MGEILDLLVNYMAGTGFGQFHWTNGVMILVGSTFIFLAIRKGFEPLLLVPIGFGMLIGNIPYDARQLPLSIVDGPASPADLHYMRVEIASVVLKEDGRLVDLDLERAWEVLQARAGDDADPQPLRPWDHAKFVALVNGAQAVNLVPESVQEIASQVSGQLAVEKGEAIAVNSHSMLTLRRNLEHRPALVPMGQGRIALVDGQAADGRYPEFWPMSRQDPYKASVFYWLFAGVGIAGFYPPLIFLGIGALTDFGPMLSNPRTLLLGAAAQLGIFGAMLAALFFGFTLEQAASIGIIGGADGPTAIFTCAQLAPELLGAVALAAYSYMALVPIIQPPIIKLLTTRRERLIRMEQPRQVSKTVKIVFPIAGFLLTAATAPGALPLLGMLFFGNLLRESMVTDRLAKTAQTAFIDIVTILLGVTVGAKTQASTFLTPQTIYIFILGVCAFSISTAGGVLFGKIMNAVSKQAINPMIGAAGVSAVPMAARVVHKMGQAEDPQNFLLMHAMGPNVAGVIGSAVAAGVLLSRLSGG